MTYFFITNLLSLLIMICSILIVVSSNRIYSILYLILIYMSCSLLFMYIGAVLLGLLYFLVYIGAVAVLFLFSIMILDLKTAAYENDYTSFFNLFVVLCAFFISVLLFMNEQFFFLYDFSYEYYLSLNDMLRMVGLMVFGEYQMIFTFCGMILLISMIGAILLTNKKSGFFIRKQQSALFRNRYLHNVSIY